MTDRALQPLLHDLVVTLAAPTSALSGADGQIRASGVQGVFHADTRVLSRAVLRLDGREPESVGHAPAGAGETRFVSVARWLGDRINDPTVRIDRTRRIRPGRLEEQIEIASTASVPVATTVTVEVAADVAPIELVRSGRGDVPRPDPATVPSLAGIDVRIDGDLDRTIALRPGERVVLRWSLAVDDPGGGDAGPPRAPRSSGPVVRAPDRRLDRLVDRSLDDLAALRLTTGTDDGDTLLRRRRALVSDAVRPGQPLGGADAAAARHRAGRRHAAGARPPPGHRGRPGHRRGARARSCTSCAGRMWTLPRRGHRLPAAYYGTIDATPLWISLLHDAWRWGLPRRGGRRRCCRSLEAALGWLAELRRPRRRRLPRVRSTPPAAAWPTRAGRTRPTPCASTTGGWPSRRSRWPRCRGTRTGPRCDGAALLDAFGRPGGDRWRAYAAALADRFRARFWVDGGRLPGPRPRPGQAAGRLADQQHRPPARTPAC